MKREIKVRLGLVTATAATMFSLGACGNTNVSSQQPVQHTTTNEQPVEPVTDPVEVDPVEVDPVEVEPVEVDPVEEEFTVTAEQITILTDLQSVSHQQIPREEIFALAMSFNWDYITDEDKETIMNTYGVSLEDLDNYFRAYLERAEEMAIMNRRYYHGDIATLEDAYDYKYWINYADFAFKSEDADFASSVDYYFIPGGTALSEYDMEDNSSKYENSFNSTLFYVLNPSVAIEEMENSVFIQ